MPAAIRTVASYILGRIEEFVTQCPGPNTANNVSLEIGGSCGRVETVFSVAGCVRMLSIEFIRRKNGKFIR